MIFITPPNEHAHFDVLFSAGLLFIRTVGEPGAHGVHAGVHGTGTYGPGTNGTGQNIPRDCAVAVITAGLPGLLHIPNEVGGLGISIIVAAS